ncbi:MAG: hypothetical protein CVV13_11635 [Gammaproteobacteria bacterium HGW-Gammaproteobacteria-3]|nr:MAG: hypothetical protein CVV13_11635 [Gammaproteobacteria bacterium HGW-Gammaproteobacteria-3]
MKKKPATESSTTEHSLDQRALFLSNSGKYKEAIELYKKLLRDTDNSDWRQQFAHCYLQRALAFAAKGMFKEALVLWENYSQRAQAPYAHYDHYLSWLIQTQNPVATQSALAQLSARQLDQQYPALAAWLGLLIITEHPEFQQALPQDSDFIAHLKLAQSALQAYQENNPEGMDEALKHLPYRSAFRDFRTLLKAVAALPATPDQLPAALSKIPTHSAYAKAASLLLASTQKGTALAQAMTACTHAQRRLIGELSGLSKKQLELIEQLSKQKTPLSDKIKFNLAIQYQSLCGTELAQRFCFGLLARYPAGQRDLNKNFGAVDDFEQNRLKALTQENNNNDAEYYWRQCIRALPQDGTDNALKTALILRHMASRQELSEKIDTLAESLEYDPEDLDCYLQVLRYYSEQGGSAQNYKQWLDKALVQFPQNIEVLTLAIAAATRSKAHKKANQYAAKLLTLDPLNSFAKQALFSSHLAHARKLFKTKKYPLVEAEIQQAEALQPGKNTALQAQLLRGFLNFATQDKQQGLNLITDALNKLDADPLSAHFQIALEAQLTGLPVTTLLTELPPVKGHLLSPPELTRFVRLLTQYNQEHGGLESLHKALEKVKAPLKKSISQQHYDENLLLALCQALDTLKHFELLRHCAKYGVSTWQKPIWTYYRIYSETNGNPHQCSFKQSLSLKVNLNDARQEKDHKTVMLIGNYLDRYHQAHAPVGMDFLDRLFGVNDENEEDEAENPFDALFGHLPDEIFYKLDRQVNVLTKKISPERLIQDLTKITGSKPAILMSIMKNPDIFSALLILKAAEDLGINIEVGLEDVINAFNIGKNTGSGPF